MSVRLFVRPFVRPVPSPSPSPSPSLSPSPAPAPSLSGGEKKNGEGEGGNLVREGGEKWKRKEKENILEKEKIWQASEQMKCGSKNMKLIMIKMMMMPTKREETEAAPT